MSKQHFLIEPILKENAYFINEGIKLKKITFYTDIITQNIAIPALVNGVEIELKLINK